MERGLTIGAAAWERGVPFGLCGADSGPLSGCFCGVAVSEPWSERGDRGLLRRVGFGDLERRVRFGRGCKVDARDWGLLGGDCAVAPVAISAEGFEGASCNTISRDEGGEVIAMLLHIIG